MFYYNTIVSENLFDFLQSLYKNQYIKICLIKFLNEKYYSKLYILNNVLYLDKVKTESPYIGAKFFDECFFVTQEFNIENFYYKNSIYSKIVSENISEIYIVEIGKEKKKFNLKVKNQNVYFD